MDSLITLFTAGPFSSEKLLRPQPLFTNVFWMTNKNDRGSQCYSNEYLHWRISNKNHILIPYIMKVIN